MTALILNGAAGGIATLVSVGPAWRRCGNGGPPTR